MSPYYFQIVKYPYHSEAIIIIKGLSVGNVYIRSVEAFWEYSGWPRPSSFPTMENVANILILPVTL